MYFRYTRMPYFTPKTGVPYLPPEKTLLLRGNTIPHNNLSRTPGTIANEGQRFFQGLDQFTVSDCGSPAE